MVYASVVVVPKGKHNKGGPHFFYLGATESCELCEVADRLKLWDFALSLGPKPYRYMTLPSWLHDKVKREGFEILRVSEFDQRTCSSGGGIPSVETQVKLDFGS